jgi:hypothetical protein
MSGARHWEGQSENWAAWARAPGHDSFWAYPLSDYTRTPEEAGFLIEALREPPDPDRPLPNFLLFRAVRR